MQRLENTVLKVRHFKAVTVDFGIKNTVKPKVICTVSQ